MSTDSLLRAVAAGALAAAGIAHAAGPGLGKPLSAAEVAPLAISVFPDGRGLPAGRATAVDGVDAYLRHCARCHGTRGQGKPGPALTGGLGSLATKNPVRTVGSYWPYATTLFDYIRRSMPYDAPMSLTDEEVYGVTAYVLWANGIVGRDTVLDATSLPGVRMPNRAGFVNAWEEPAAR